MVKSLKSHTIDQQADSLGDYLPSGPLFIAKKIPNKKLRKLLKGLAATLKKVEQDINLVTEEYDIRTTTLLIEEWEGFVGIPDSCFSIADTIEQRRQNVLTKLGALGVQTEADFIALAALFGVPVTITPGEVAGVFPMTFPITFFDTPKQARFTMLVNLTLPLSNRFPVVFPIPFGSDETSILRCLFNKLRPANVNVIFREI